MAGVDCIVRPSDLEEVRAQGESARDYVGRLSIEKAAAQKAEAHQGILAADTTVVVLDGTNEIVLEKPDDARHAQEMLRLLAGRAHSVFTGVCFQYGERRFHCVEETRVHFAPMTEAEIASYVASGEAFGKAGAYAIQGQASRYIERVEGCYFNVVGLPVHRSFALFGAAGVLAKA